MAASAVVPPPGMENQDRGPELRAFIIVMMAIAFAAVVLRIWSRLIRTPDARGIKQIRLWWDDWAVLAAMVGKGLCKVSACANISDLYSSDRSVMSRHDPLGTWKAHLGCTPAESRSCSHKTIHDLLLV
jgi:hypothetical protein